MTDEYVVYSFLPGEVKMEKSTIKQVIMNMFYKAKEAALKFFKYLPAHHNYSIFAYLALLKRNTLF